MTFSRQNPISHGFLPGFSADFRRFLTVLLVFCVDSGRDGKITEKPMGFVWVFVKNEQIRWVFRRKNGFALLTLIENGVK